MAEPQPHRHDDEATRNYYRPGSTVHQVVAFIVTGPEAAAYFGPIPIQVRLVHDPAEPCVVRFEIRGGRGTWVDWHMARSLLRDGLYWPTGHGDVRIEQGPAGRVRLHLHSDSGCGRFDLVRSHVVDFLAATYFSAPDDDLPESTLDTLIDQLLDDRT